jgi:hypothetical protein
MANSSLANLGMMAGPSKIPAVSDHCFFELRSVTYKFPHYRTHINLVANL